MAAAPPQLFGEPVDVRHDLARRRHLALMALLDEVVLHVDHEQRGLAGIDGIERMHLSHPGLHAVEGGLGNRDLVHRFVL